MVSRAELDIYKPLNISAMRSIIYKSVTLLVVLLCLTACSSRRKVSVGISMGPVHERWEKDQSFLTQHLETRGAKVTVLRANGNEKDQIRQANKIIEDNVDVMILIPVNSNTAGTLVDYAKNKGVSVLAYDRIVNNCKLDFYVSFDNVRVGEMQAEFLTSIKPEGNYAILSGDPDDNNSVLIRLGQMNILQPLIIKNDIKIVLDKNVEDWDTDNAYRILTDFLNEHDPPDAVLAANDAIAKGVAQAIEEKGLTGKVLVSGQDAEPNACRRIVNGKQTMTVYKVIESLAATAANIAINLAEGKSVYNTQTTVNNGQKMVPAILLTSMIPVSSENIRMTVIADGYLDEEEVFGDR